MMNEQTTEDHATAKALQEEKDQAYAQAIADEQREEAFWCGGKCYRVKCMPLEPETIFRPRQPNKDSRHQLELRAELQSAYNQRRPRMSYSKQLHERPIAVVCFWFGGCVVR